jgi:hypothetical protein
VFWGAGYGSATLFSHRERQPRQARLAQESTTIGGSPPAICIAWPSGRRSTSKGQRMLSRSGAVGEATDESTGPGSQKWTRAVAAQLPEQARGATSAGGESSAGTSSGE